MSKAARGREPQMKAEPILVKYGGRVLELSPEASVRIRKLARGSRRSVASVVRDILEKSASARAGVLRRREVLSHASIGRAKKDEENG